MSEDASHGAGAAGLDAPATGRFLHGWGGVAAVVLGLLIAAATAQAAVLLWSLVDRLLVTIGVSVLGRVGFFYWLSFAAGVIYLAYMLVRPLRVDPLDGLRRGVGDWALIRRIALGFGPFGALLWTAFNAPAGLSTQHDEYAHGAAGVWASVLIVVVLALGWFVRSRRAHGSADLKKANAGPS